MHSINLPASRRWQTVGSYPKPRVTDRRAEWYLRWLDHLHSSQRISPDNRVVKAFGDAEPIEPPLRWLVEVLFVLFAASMIAMVYAVAKDTAAKHNNPTPAVHEKR